MMLIRIEIPPDAAAIDLLLCEAINADSAHLLHCLREKGLLTLGLVATDEEGNLVGYLAFSPATVDGEERQWVALAALAVASDWRGQGIAGKLIDESFDMLLECGYQAALVTGAPAFYDRFGFTPAARHGLQAPLSDGSALNDTGDKSPLSDTVLQIRWFTDDESLRTGGCVVYPRITARHSLY